MQVILASPRGFCAGVDRAIEIVDRALQRYGAPIYVRHEVVHNRFVVEDLRSRGAVFVDELDEVPDGATVIFSAHGVPRAVRGKAAVLLKGRRLPVVGRVTMDYVMVDCGPDGGGVRRGDVATLVGRDGDGAIGLDEFARWAGTIAYESLTSLGRRVPRVYREP